MAKKSTAQLKRLEKRAKARGEVYMPQPPAPASDVADDGITNPFVSASVDRVNRVADVATTESPSHPSDSTSNKAKIKAILQLQNDLANIEANDDLKAKERRSAKRKAEAIAVESCDCVTVDELLLWYEKVGKELEVNQQLQSSKIYPHEKVVVEKKKTNPYILFIGQLSYDTTNEDLFQHIKKNLENDHIVTDSNIKIRLLHDKGSKKSRGMAFVEVLSHDPGLMYACLKLHRTHLKGRRINVERSAGGGVQTRKMKIQRHRAQQEQFIDEAVTAMLNEYYERGEIQRTGELGEGVIQLCKRHSTTVVQAALERYVDSNGRDMDNPSAYLSFLLTKLAEEGIYNNRDKTDELRPKASSEKSRINTRQFSRRGEETTSLGDQAQSPEKKTRKCDTNVFKDSEFTKQGIDMTLSEGKCELLKIFPSLSRGRGRGRGYM
jgi:RNA recognition motif-containing protein